MKFGYMGRSSLGEHRPKKRWDRLEYTTGDAMYYLLMLAKMIALGVVFFALADIVVWWIRRHRK